MASINYNCRLVSFFWYIINRYMYALETILSVTLYRRKIVNFRRNILKATVYDGCMMEVALCRLFIKYSICQHVKYRIRHNLLLGTAKYMNDVWVKVGLLSTQSYSTIEETTSFLTCPCDIERLPIKVGSSFSGFTADQWKLWTTVYSFIALKGVLPDNHKCIWLLFVCACLILCSRIEWKLI